MMKKPVIFLSTFEFSGDMHGAVLLAELKKLLPEAHFYGIGGGKMAEAGMEVIFDPTKESTLGFTEALKNLGKIPRLLKEIYHQWEQRRPDVVIWLDSGGFNLKVAKEAKKLGIPVICMFSPSAWAYWENRAVKLSQRVKLLLAVLPFEADFYRRFGANAKYIGHPLIDRVFATNPEAFRKQVGVNPGQKLVALMPGSRRQELANLLPVMLEAASELTGEIDIKWVLPLAGSIDREYFDSIAAPYKIKLTIITEGTYDLLAAADGAVIASGTATLEAAILNTPMIVVYRLSKLTLTIYRLLQTKEQRAKSVASTPIALPNIIMGQEVVPEVKQENLTAANVARELRHILSDSDYNTKIREELLKVRQIIGPEGVMARAAKEIASLIGN
jgi:lipid-A-disaccharide synthase